MGFVYAKRLSRQQSRMNRKKKIRNALAYNIIDLVQNPFGNYTVQLALTAWKYEYCYPLVQKFNSLFCYLSMQKYSSNVIEKCLELGDENLIGRFVDEVCQQSNIVELMKNSYGNYVIQKGIKLAKEQNKQKLLSNIFKHLDKLNDLKLIIKWKGILTQSMRFNTNNNYRVQQNFSPQQQNISFQPHYFSPNLSSSTAQFNIPQQSLFSRSVVASPNRMSNEQMHFFYQNQNQINNLSKYTQNSVKKSSFI